MDIKQVTENTNKPEKQQKEQNPKEETHEQQEQTHEQKQEQTQEQKQKLNTLYKIFLFKDGVKTEKYYFYCNKAKPSFNLYKARKNKKLIKYCTKNNYTIENIYSLAYLTNETKKLYLKEVLKDTTNCINNLFNRKQNKKDNKDLPTVTTKEQLKEFLTH